MQIHLDSGCETIVLPHKPQRHREEVQHLYELRKLDGILVIQPFLAKLKYIYISVLSGTVGPAGLTL